MSWDEALFRLVWKLKRGRRQAAGPADLANPRGACPERRGPGSSGGRARRRLCRRGHLPATHHPSGAQSCRQCSRLPVPRRLSGHLAQAGVYAAEANGLSVDFRTFRTLLSVPPTRRLLESAMPASQDLWKEFGTLLLGDRPIPSVMDSTAAASGSLGAGVAGTETRRPVAVVRITEANRFCLPPLGRRHGAGALAPL